MESGLASFSCLFKTFGDFFVALEGHFRWKHLFFAPIIMGNHFDIAHSIEIFKAAVQGCLRA